MIPTVKATVTKTSIRPLPVRPLARRHSGAGRMWIFLAMVALLILVWKVYFTPYQIKSDVPFKLKYIEKVFGPRKKGPLPMMIFLHGSGGNEMELMAFEKIPIPLRVIGIRGPERVVPGYGWDSTVYGATQEEAEKKHDQMFKNLCLSIAESVSELKRRFPTAGKPILFGYSRGGSIAYYLAVNFPDSFSSVFAVSGYLDSKFIPDRIVHKYLLPPIFAFHGRNDEIVPIEGMMRSFL